MVVYIGVCVGGGGDTEHETSEVMELEITKLR